MASINVNEIPAPVIEADPDIDGDSVYADYSSGFESDTTSLISAAKSHVFENGRQYHGYKEPTWVPPNLKFEVDDIEEDWTFQDNSFDFIHVRTMAGYIYDWPKFYKQAFKALKPGGWIELQCFGDGFSVDDDSPPHGNILTKWVDYWITATEKSGRPFSSLFQGNAKALAEVGCVDVTMKTLNFPIGRWPKGKHEKELGIYWRRNLLDAVESTCLALMRIFGWGK
ncbi:hypothetical protein RUND412_002934 [Rhizina undulata]